MRVRLHVDVLGSVYEFCPSMQSGAPGRGKYGDERNEACCNTAPEIQPTVKPPTGQVGLNWGRPFGGGENAIFGLVGPLVNFGGRIRHLFTKYRATYLTTI